MIENSDPGVTPGMPVRHDLYLGSLLEPINWDYFAIIVERSDSNDLSRPNIDEPVRVQRSVVVAHIERSARRHRLHIGIERAVRVGELKPALHWERFPGVDVGNPDDRTGKAGPEKRDVLLYDRVSADALIDCGPDERRRGR